MNLKHYNVYFFFAVLVGVSAVAYFILKPFLVPFLVAAILAHLFGFIYRWFLRYTGERRGVSSALTCFVVALVILVPVVLISTLVVNEVEGVIKHFSGNGEGVKGTIENTIQSVASLPVLKSLDIERLIDRDVIASAVRGVSQNTLAIVQSTYRSVAHLIFVIFIMFFSLFYLLIDGSKLLGKIMQLSPLRDEYENKLVERFNSISRATIKGSLLVSLMQGFIGGMLFWMTGVPSPVLLGIIMTVSSVIPSVGAGLVWLPAGVIMIAAGNTAGGIVILIIGGLIISTVDNIVRQKLVGRDTEMHPLIILFATLGGITLFGISGFIVGPIILSLFLALWEIYALEFKRQLANFNK